MSNFVVAIYTHSLLFFFATRSSATAEKKNSLFKISFTVYVISQSVKIHTIAPHMILCSDT